MAEHSAAAGEADRACHAAAQVWGGRGRWGLVWGRRGRWGLVWGGRGRWVQQCSGKGKALAVWGRRVYGMQMRPQAVAVGEQLHQLPAAPVANMSGVTPVH